MGLKFCLGCLGVIRCKHVGLRKHGGGADAVKENKLQMTTDACGWRKDMEGYGSGCTQVQNTQAHARTKEHASKHLKETYEEDAEFVIDDDLVYTEDNYVIHCKTWHPDWSEERSRHDFELKLDGQTDKSFAKGAKRFPRIRIPDPQARIRKQTGVVHKRGVVETNEIPVEWAQAESRRLLAKLRGACKAKMLMLAPSELATGAASSRSLDGDSEVAHPTAAYSERCTKPTSESSKSAGRKRTAESVMPSIAASTVKFPVVCAGGSDGGAGDDDKKDKEKGGACGTIRQNVTMMNSVEFLQMKGELQARTLAELKRVQGKNGMKVMLAAVSETCKKKGCSEADLPNSTDTILTSCQAHVDCANVLAEKAKHCMKSTLFECFDELAVLHDAIDATSKVWNEQYQALIFKSKSQGNENRKEYQSKRWLL